MDSHTPPPAGPQPCTAAPGRPAPPASPEGLREPGAAPPGREYHRALAGENRRIGRGVLAIALVFAGLFGIGGAVAAAGAQLDLALGNANPAAGGRDYTAVFHAANTLGIALLIPWAMLVQRWLYGVRGATLVSVASAFRFELLGRYLLIVGPAAVLAMAVLSLITPAEQVAWPIAQLTGVLTVTLLLTPLQAAGEEFGFRGLVFRAAASWARTPRAGLAAGVAVSTVLFALAHPQTSPWLSLNLVLLSVGAALITWRTGGLEIAILVHALNNVLSQVYAQALHLDLLDGAVEPSIVLASLPTVIATAVVFWRTRGRERPAVPGGRPPRS